MDALSRFLSHSIISGLFIIPLVALVVINGLYFPFITGKAFAFRLIVEVIFALWILLILREPAYRPRFSWLLVVITTFVVWIGIVNLFAVDPSKAWGSNFERMDGYVTLLHVFAYFLVAGTVMKTTLTWYRFFHVWLGTGLFLAGYGYMQMLGAFPTHMSGERIDATLGNSTYLAVIGIFMFFFSLFFVVRNRTDLQPALMSVILGSGLFVAHSIYFYIGRFNEAYAQFGGQIPEGVSIDFWVNASHTLWFLGSLVAIGVGWYMWMTYTTWSSETRARIHTTLYVVMGSMFAGMILLTRTRGAILGVLGGVGITVVLLALFAHAQPVVRKTMAVCALIAVLFGGVLGAMVMTNTLGTTSETPVIRHINAGLQHVPGMERVANIALGDTTVRSRFMVWSMALEGFQDRPLRGWGQGNFAYVFNAYYNPLMFDQEPWFDRAHNVILEWLVAGGIAGGALYVLMFVVALGYVWYEPDHHIWGRMKSAAERVMYTLTRFKDGAPLPNIELSIIDKSIITGMLAAYLFHNIFVFDHLISYVLFFGFLASIYALYTPDRYPRLGGTGTVSHSVYQVVVIPIVITITLGSIYMNVYRPMQANAALIDGLRFQQQGSLDASFDAYNRALAYRTIGLTEIRTQMGSMVESVLTREDVSQEQKQRYFERAQAEFEQQIEDTPQAVRPYLHYGALLMRAGLYADAQRQFERAHELSPHKQLIAFQLINVYLEQGQAERAHELAAETFLLAPAFDQAREIYAYTSLVTNDQEALEEAMTYQGDLTEDEQAMSPLVLNGYIATEQWDEVVRLLQRRVHLLTERMSSSPGNQSLVQNAVQTYVRFAGIYANIGREADARILLDKARSQFPEYTSQFDALEEQF